jgi:hypothetical protein
MIFLYSMKKRTIMTVNELIELLDNCATRGFLSTPVKSRYSNMEEQVVIFTAEEKQQIRQFMAENVKVLRGIDYPMSNMFDEEPRRTVSLLSMLGYMMSMGNSAEYVAQIAQKLTDAKDLLNAQAEISRLERLI